MAYDETLADLLRAMLARRKGITKKKMSGGVCFLVNGHMCCGVNEADLVLRLGMLFVSPCTGPPILDAWKRHV